MPSGLEIIALTGNRQQVKFHKPVCFHHLGDAQQLALQGGTLGEMV
jgi:hypothetical protein